MTEKNSVAILTESLVSNKYFRGVVVSYDKANEGREGDYASITFPKGIKKHAAMAMLNQFTTGLNALGNCTTEDLIEELKRRPGFFGVILQAPSYEATEVLGKLALRCDVSDHLPRKLVPELLGLMTAISENDLKDQSEGGT